MPSSLTDEQRQSVDEQGTPLPLLDELTGTAYMLLNIEFIPDPKEGTFIARIPTINAFGEGDTKEEAALALSASLRGYLQAFS